MGYWQPNRYVDGRGIEWVNPMKQWQHTTKLMAHYQVDCKNCGSGNIVRYGSDRSGRQRFKCKTCGYVFTDNDAPKGMRFPVDAIASALNQFYEASSLHKIRRQLRFNYNVEPDVSNIYRWVVKYTDIAVRQTIHLPINVGDEWVADETVLRLKSGTKKGEQIWFWDVIDSETRFLLASHLSRTRTTRDARVLMERAERRARRTPDLIFTDKLQAYLGGVEDVFGADSVHVQSGPFKILQSTRDIERFHGTLKDRTKVMRSLANRETAKTILDGWLVHYNFFRPHSGIGNRTPAEEAGVRGAFKSWKDVVRMVE